jgi:two-component system chemotaxis response regulator CheB
VIDDSLTIRAMIEQVISEQPGCRVVGTAADVATAKQMLADLLPNIITLDLAMPGLDGFAFLDALRGTLHPPIVVVSGSTQSGSEIAAKALAHGAAACFDKRRIVSGADEFVNLLKDASKRKPILAASAIAEAHLSEGAGPSPARDERARD